MLKPLEIASMFVPVQDLGPYCQDAHPLLMHKRDMAVTVSP